MVYNHFKSFKLKPNQNRKQPGTNGAHAQTQKPLHAKEVTAVHPSRSGNSRVRVELSNGRIYQFYMTPKGEEHIPEGHKGNNKVTLDDNELAWAHRKWSKDNPAVVREILPVGSMFKKAEALAIKKFNASKQITRPKHVYLPKSGVTLGAAFGDKLAEIKERCTK